MLRLTLRNIAARKLRFVLTTAAIVLGVGFTTGALVLTDTARQVFDRQFARAAGGVDAVVRDASTSSPEMGPAVRREPVPPDVLDRIRRVAGVAEADGVVLGAAPLVVRGRPVVAEDVAAGSSWVDSPSSAFRLRSGRPPRAPDEVVIDADTATGADLEPGERLSVVHGESTSSYVLVGTVGVGDAPGAPGMTFALFTPETARSVFGLGAGWSEIHVAADADTSPPELQRRLAAALGDRFVVTTTQDIAAARAQDAREQLRYLTLLLVVLAGAALLVGSFLIANTFAILVAQRSRELATLRALGASVRQVRASVLVEALLVGALASGTGLVLGIAVASGLSGLAETFGVVVPDGQLTVRPRAAAVGLGVGVGVTLLAAALPARRAARVSPVTAMREGAFTTGSGAGARVALGAASLTAGALLLLLATSTGSVPLVGLAGAGLLVGAVLLGPVVVRAATSALSSPLDRRVVPRLARVNVGRAANRTAATSAALVAGLAVVTFMTVVATSAKQAVGQGIDQVIRADLVIQSTQGVMGGLPPQVYDHVLDLPGVEVASRTRHGHWRTGDGAVRSLTAVDPATLPLVTALDLPAGAMHGLARGGVVLTERAAVEHGVSLGDRLDMTFPETGPQAVDVVGLLDDRRAWPLGTDYLIALEEYAEHFVEEADAAVLLRVSDGADPAGVRAAAEVALAPFPTADVLDQAAVEAAETETFDAVLGLVRVLLLLTLLIAVLGMTNTIALSVVERTREIGMLRAVGMTRRQVGRLIRIEAALVATVGGTTGVALGLAVGAAMVHALADRKVIDLAVPVAQLGGYLLVAGLAGALAGAIPGRRAARMDVLAAVSRA